MKKYILSIILLFGGAFFDLLAQNNLVPGTFRIDPPTVHCLGFRWAVTGDANLDGKAAVQYREAGTSTWKDALKMLRQDGQDLVGGDWQVANMFAGSIFGLSEGTSYEVKVALTDPDNGGSWSVDTMVTVSTNTYPPKFVGSKEVHVYPPGYSGTKLSPNYASIEDAGVAATPGTRILIHGGVYTGTYAMVLNGTKDNPIVFHGVGDGEAILDGGGSPPTVNDDPILAIKQSKHVYIENLTMRNCNNLNFAGSEGIVIRNCKIIDIYDGITFGSGTNHSNDCFVMNNTIRGIHPWYPRVEPPSDPTGVVACGQNMVVCFNDISDLWDGITNGYPSAPDDKTDPHIRSLDFYNNYIHNMADDHIETDYSHGNVRVWNNLCVNACHGLSAQPVLGGPVYFFRNIVFNCEKGPLKFHNQPSGMEVYNNTFVAGWYSNSGWRNGTLKNNLFLDTRSWLVFETGSKDSPPRTHLDYNGYYDTIFTNAGGWQSYIKWVNPDLPDGRCGVTNIPDFFAETGHEEHGLRVGYPDFVNLFDPIAGVTYDSSELDFRIASVNSRAVDKGCILPSITDGYSSSAPDLGALEYGASLPHYGVYTGDSPPVGIKKEWSPTSLRLRGVNDGISVSAFPNPFRSSVIIRALAGNEIQSLKVYDVNGRMVYKSSVGAIHESPVRSNMHVWEGIDNYGRSVANGSYFIKVQASKVQAMKQVNLVR